MIQDANFGKLSIILAEAMDRLSRDQEDIAGFFKRMNFAGVRIVTLAEGDVTDLHVGLKGTMNALFLKDLAAKTHRGLRGRVIEGKSGGGLCYGYEVVRRLSADGESVRGDRKINEAEAAIVRRIFSEYIAGASSRTIALRLNKEGIPGQMARNGGHRQFMATTNVEREFSTTNSTSGVSSGISFDTSKIPTPESESRDLIPTASG